MEIHHLLISILIRKCDVKFNSLDFLSALAIYNIRRGTKNFCKNER